MTVGAQPPFWSDIVVQLHTLKSLCVSYTLYSENNGNANSAQLNPFRPGQGYKPIYSQSLRRIQITFHGTSETCGADYTSPLDLDKLPRLPSLSFEAPYDFPKLTCGSKGISYLWLLGRIYDEGDLAPFRLTLRTLVLDEIYDGSCIDLPCLKYVRLFSCRSSCAKQWSGRGVKVIIEPDDDDNLD